MDRRGRVRTQIFGRTAKIFCRLSHPNSFTIVWISVDKGSFRSKECGYLVILCRVCSFALYSSLHAVIVGTMDLKEKHWLDLIL